MEEKGIGIRNKVLCFRTTARTFVYGVRQYLSSRAYALILIAQFRRNSGDGNLISRLKLSFFKDPAFRCLPFLSQEGALGLARGMLVLETRLDMGKGMHGGLRRLSPRSADHALQGCVWQYLNL